MTWLIFGLLAQSLAFPGPGWKSATRALSIGFDFRATAGYVTDPANTQFVSDSPSYNGSNSCTGNQTVICGWEGSVNGARDRNAAIDARLAGIVFIDNNSGRTCFRVDLPAAGTYSIRVALGDAGNGQTNQLLIQDASSVLATIGAPTATATAHFLDATGTDYSAAAWPGSNSAVSLTFSTTIFRACLGADNGDSGTNSAIAYLSIGL